MFRLPAAGAAETLGIASGGSDPKCESGSRAAKAETAKAPR
jgi:hypothetical protein